MEYYILDKNRNPEKVEDIWKFNEFMEYNRIVKQDWGLPWTWVSTVFLWLDHSFSDDEEPILWETMIFVDDMSWVQQFRYSSEKDAIEWHKKAVELAKSKYGLVLDD